MSVSFSANENCSTEISGTNEDIVSRVQRMKTRTGIDI